MSDRIKNEKNLPITYSINIKTLSTSKRPLTCYITTAPRTSNQLNYLKPSICLDKSINRSSIHLPVTYSTSIHVPCHPPTITQPSPINLPSPSHHHYHHYHHHYYHHHHQRQPSTIKHKILPRSTSIASTRPATTSTTTITSPESSSLPSKKLHKKIPTSSSHPPPLPSYSTLVWNWFHHTPPKPQSPHKGSQSDYSEICRHEVPHKRNLLFKLLTSPSEKQSKSKHHRTCFTRKRLESSSSLPNKYHHYNE